MKIQETVYELLNQQYEMARIQEAKEIPTVNVVDFANVPEKKSFPPRFVVILGLTLSSCVVAAICTVASHNWQKVDPRNPGKMFAERVWCETCNSLHTWFRVVLTRLGLNTARRDGKSSLQSE